MRVFVAVDVGDAVRREVTRVVGALTGKLEAVKTPPKVVWVKPAALHVTVKFIGEVEPPEVERLQELLMPPIAVAPFELVWRGIGTFPSPKNPRALWLGVTHGAAPLAADRSGSVAAARRRRMRSSSTIARCCRTSRSAASRWRAPASTGRRSCSPSRSSTSRRWLTA